MSSNMDMILVEGHGWQRGMRPMIRRENRKWWASKRWLLQLLLWAGIFDGILFTALFIFPKLTTPDGQPLIPDDPFSMGVNLFFGMGIMGTAIGAIILLQDAILGERESGTAEWVLSKPISRTAYVLTKLLPNLVGMLVTMILVPAAIGYVLFQQYDPGLMTLEAFAKAEGLVVLHMLFYITLTLMMGVLAKNRSALLGVTFASLLGGGMVPTIEIVRFTPWALGQMTLSPILGLSLGALGTTMLLSTAAWSVIFIIVAIWRFKQLEF